MSKAEKTAPSGSKRRVKIRRKGAEPTVDPAIAYAIGQALEAQDLEGLRKIILDHEAQMHSLRVILFDLMIIFREEHYKARDPVSKARFAQHVDKVRATLEQNVPEFKQYHGNLNDVDDLDAQSVALDEDWMEMGDEGAEPDIAQLIREAADDAVQREGEAESLPVGIDPDLMDEMLERASEETDTPSPYDGGALPRRHPRTQSRQPARRGPRRPRR